MDRALQEELGLKVEAAKGPSKVLVIDRMLKPSENERADKFSQRRYFRDFGSKAHFRLDKGKF